MKPVNINDYAGYICFIGVDLSSVSDFTSLSVLIPVEDKFIYKTWCFLPKETLKTSPNKELYSKFIQEKTMIPTSGNVTDYDYVINKIQELNKILNIQGIYYDQ